MSEVYVTIVHRLAQWAQTSRSCFSCVFLFLLLLFFYFIILLLYFFFYYYYIFFEEHQVLLAAGCWCSRSRSSCSSKNSSCWNYYTIPTNTQATAIYISRPTPLSQILQPPRYSNPLSQILQPHLQILQTPHPGTPTLLPGTPTAFFFITTSLL